MASIACERIEGDNSGSKPNTSQFGFRLGASVRAIAIALKCPHPGCDRATLKHSPSINDLCSSGMASPIWQKIVPSQTQTAGPVFWLVVLAIFTGAGRALFCGLLLRLGPKLHSQDR
jgi:hypothetical protein